MDDFSRVRSLMQGIVLLCVSPIGVLGFMTFASQRNVGMMAMFGIITPASFALGVWLILRARQK
jgi:cyanate permease